MSNKTAVVWGQSNCVWCERVVGLLGSFGYAVEYRKIGETCSKADFISAVPGARSVPQVVIGGKVIGGYEAVTGYLTPNA